MSFGYSSNTVNVMEEEIVRKIVPKEFQSFLDALNQASNDPEDEELEGDDFSLNSNLDAYLSDDDLADHPANVAYKAFQQAFQEATGLTIWHGYHNSDDEGSRYDEVNGYFWALGNVNAFTPQALVVLHKYGKTAITEQSFVVGC